MLGGVLGYELSRIDEGERWVRLAEATVERMGPGHERVLAWALTDRAAIPQPAPRLRGRGPVLAAGHRAQEADPRTGSPGPGPLAHQPGHRAHGARRLHRGAGRQRPGAGDHRPRLRRRDAVQRPVPEQSWRDAQPARSLWRSARRVRVGAGALAGAAWSRPQESRLPVDGPRAGAGRHGPGAGGGRDAGAGVTDSRA